MNRHFCNISSSAYILGQGFHGLRILSQRLPKTCQGLSDRFFYVFLLLRVSVSCSALGISIVGQLTESVESSFICLYMMIHRLVKRFTTRTEQPTAEDEG